MNIIPKPLKAEALGAEISFSKATAVAGDFPETAAFAVKTLAGRKKAEENTLTFVKDDTYAEEGYGLSYRDGDIKVKASTEKGAFHGFMTLCQLSMGGNKFTAVKVKDEPKYAHRGFMLDSARHFWTIDKIKQILDVMASLKMSIFHWHLTDDQGWRAEIKKYPLLTQKGTTRDSTAVGLKGYNGHKEPRENKPYGEGLFYSQDDMREIVAYAKERHIDVIPEVDMPGHLVAAIACYPELSCTGEPTEVSNRWGVLDNIGCCGKEDVYTFAKDVIDELCEIFPYPYFHIGGDEVPKKRWKVCPKCQAKIKELGLKDEDALQGYFNNVICAHLKSKGRKTIGWNEILDATEGLDRDIIPQWWVKRKPAQKLELNWLKNGGKMILSFHDSVYMDHAFAIRPLKTTYNFTAASIGITDDSNVLGMEAPQWTEYIRDERKFDFNTYVRLMAIAEAGWTADDIKDYRNFEERIENMREFFASMGARMAPQEFYRGKTVCPIFGRVGWGWKKWRDNPNFELEMAEKKGLY